MPIIREDFGENYNIVSSNRNLIDNAWFTINQRGIQTWTSSDSEGYWADRWIHDVGTGGRTSGIVQADVPIYQKVEDSFMSQLLGKTVTMSILHSDNTITSEVITLPSSLPSSFTPYGTGDVILMLRSGYNDSQICRIKPNVAVKAVKLEIGPYSTLHLDTVPNYETELMKCQRYFQRLRSPMLIIGSRTQNPVFGTYTSSIPYKVSMRTTPSVQLKSLGGGDVVASIAGQINFTSDNFTLYFTGAFTNELFYLTTVNEGVVNQFGGMGLQIWDMFLSADL